MVGNLVRLPTPQELRGLSPRMGRGLRARILVIHDEKLRLGACCLLPAQDPKFIHDHGHNLKDRVPASVADKSLPNSALSSYSQGSCLFDAGRFLT